MRPATRAVLGRDPCEQKYCPGPSPRPGPHFPLHAPQPTQGQAEHLLSSCALDSLVSVLGANLTSTDVKNGGMCFVPLFWGVRDV
jgi:hypothetical protein